MATLLALLSSILWGGADFLGGKLSKRYQAIAVTAVSQAIGLAIGILIVLISSSWFRPTLSWDNYFLSGVIAGLLGFIGLVAFYTGLATGRMGVVAPISALSVTIPLTIAFINGEKPNTGQLIGMGIALTFLCKWTRDKRWLSNQANCFCSNCRIWIWWCGDIYRQGFREQCDHDYDYHALCYLYGCTFIICSLSNNRGLY